MQRRNSRNAQGIDVSRYQGKVDWKAVKADGVSFAFIKASQGQHYVDPTFTTNAKGARAAGVLLGAYHFLDAISVEAAKAEARHFAEVLEQVGGGKTLDLPPVMDYENNPGNLSKTLISAVALAFLLELERLTGRKPIIYTGNAFAANFNASLGGYPLWIARYSDTRVPSDTVTWKRWDIWQYSDSGKVKGVAGNVDLNGFDGTVDEIRTRFNKKGENKVPEQQRDINKVSPWAADVWEEMTKNGYFDGTRPGAPITREEAAAALSRLRKNILKGDKVIMEIMNQVLVFASTLVVIVIAVVQLIKKTVSIPVNYVPVVGVVIGLLIGWAALPFTDLDLSLRLWAGGLAGLSATGLFEMAFKDRPGVTKK